MTKPLALLPPEVKLLTSRDKYENSYWMEQLPAHVWVQNKDHAVIYSNRLPVSQLARVDRRYCRAKKISCFQAFMGEKKRCSCCPYQRISTTMVPETCVCRRDDEVYHVYHFPMRPPGLNQGKQPVYVMKLEINAGATGLLEVKRRNSEEATALASRARGQKPQAELVKICSSCKKVRDERGGWQEMEKYFHAACGVKFTHGICGGCACKLYPDIWAACP